MPLIFKDSANYSIYGYSGTIIPTTQLYKELPYTNTSEIPFTFK